eukprot:990463-Pelagomonas_calceolata.AAC.1
MYKLKGWSYLEPSRASRIKDRQLISQILGLKEKKAYAGRNQRALRKDPTVSAVTDHESHQYLN